MKVLKSSLVILFMFCALLLLQGARAQNYNAVVLQGNTDPFLDSRTGQPTNHFVWDRAAGESAMEPAIQAWLSANVPCTVSGWQIEHDANSPRYWNPQTPDLPASFTDYIIASCPNNASYGLGEQDVYACGPGWRYVSWGIDQDAGGNGGSSNCQSGWYLEGPNHPKHRGPPCNCKNGGAAAGDPIEVGTGNMYRQESDYVAADPRLQFSRYYNSNSTTRSPIGKGWMGSGDARIVDITELDYPLGDGTESDSSVYPDPQSACVSGFAELAANNPTAYAGDTVEYVPPVGNAVAGTCLELNASGVVVFSFTLSNTAMSVATVGAPLVINVGVGVVRDDGSQYIFNCIQGTCIPDSNVSIQLSIDASGYYTLIDEDGVTERYDNYGVLLTRTWKDGYQLSYARNGNGLTSGDGTLQTISDSHGRKISLGYDSNSQLASISTPDGQQVLYGLDANANLSTVTNPTGTRTYQYTNTAFPSALTGIVDEDSNTYATWTYDAKGNANGNCLGTANCSSGGVDPVSIVYNADGSANVTDKFGTTRTYQFQPYFGAQALTAISGPVCAGCGPGATMVYDRSGFLQSSTDWNGNVTGYTFEYGLLDQRVDALGSTSFQRTTNIAWDNVLRNPTEATIYDNANGGNVLTLKVDWLYNATGEPLARCEEDPTVSGATSYTCTNTGTAPTGVRRSVYTYCTAVDGTQCPVVGLMLTAADPLGNTTQYAYYMSTDLSGCGTVGGTCHNLGDLKTVTDALGHVSTVNAYDKNGRLAELADPNGVITDLSYNARGWLTQVARRGTDNTVTTDDQIVSYTYDPAGNVTRITNLDGSYFSQSYDPAHRLTDIAQYDSTNHLIGTIHYMLDAAGDRTKEDTRDPTGAIKRSIVRQFNALGQLATTLNADGTTVNGGVQYDPNGNPNIVTDGRGTITNNAFDALNRLYHVEQDPGIAPHVEANTTLTFDALDRTTNVQDPHGLNTQYQFDGLNDLLQRVSPDTGTTTSTYDIAGNLKTRTDARGVTATYSYDALNRVTGITYPTTALNVSYTYDTVQSICTLAADKFPVGHLTYFKDGSGSTKLCYDRFGRMTRKQQTVGTKAFLTVYDFNVANQLVNVTTPKSTLVMYTRDGVGRITKVAYRLSGQTNVTVVKAVTYYPFGPVASITYNDNRVLNRSYDQDYVISGVSDTATGGLNLGFGRDAIGNLTQVTSGATGNNLVYDGLNRLTNVNDLSNNPVWTYGYDATGNRLSKQAGTGTAVPYTYGPTSHQLQAVGSTGRGYDAMGNTTSIGTGSGSLGFVFDDTGRMSQLNNGAGTAVMQYATNALGQRVEKYLTGNSAATDFSIRDEAGELLGDYDSTGATIRENIWMDGMPVGVLSGSAGTLSYLEPDQLGTPRVAIDGTSNAATWNWPVVNDPFGEVQPTGTLSLNLRMAGQVYDAESGLYNNYFRDYDPTTGRYVESDPLGLGGGISTYGYVGGSPLSSRDPLGLIDSSLDGCYETPNGVASCTEAGMITARNVERIQDAIGLANTIARILNAQQFCAGSMVSTPHSGGDNSATNAADAASDAADSAAGDSAEPPPTLPEGGDNNNDKDEWPPEEASDKVPDDWGDGSPTRKGDGMRWQDPEDQGNGIRIDKGNPNNSQLTQQVDHVIVRSGGRVIGLDGQPINGSVAEDPVNAHIPLSEWLNWTSWNHP